MPPQNPAPNKVLPDFPFPAVVVNTVGVEQSSRYSGNWVPLEPGTPFSPKFHSLADVAENQDKIFLQQSAGDGEFFQQVWANPPTTQDLYNYDIEFSAEANDYPIFKRRYLELRDQYQPRTKGSPFTGLFAVKITAGGTGYDNTTTVSIADTGGGTGAMAIAIVNPRTGAIAKITLKTEGLGYGTGTITVTITGPGSGATASAVVQTSACVLVQEQVVQASGYWISLYQMVERVYETLPGPILTGYSQDDSYDIPFKKETQKVLASTVTEPAIILGQNTKFTPISSVESLKTVDSLDPTVMGSFYIPYIGTSSIELPRVLVSLTAVWSVTTGTGAYNESGVGASSAADVSLSMSATGRGQGSASVLPELIPVFASPPFGEVDVVDYFFFLPNPVRKADVITKVSALASDFLGVPTTVIPWPVWKPKEETFVMEGQKVSLSAEATARCAISVNSGSVVSTASSTGSGENIDLGSSVRANTLPACIHIPLTIIGGTLNSSVANASASAVLAGGGDFPGASATPPALAKTAFGGISPSTLGGTTPQGIPTTGVYAYRYNVENFKLGWSVIRVRTFDFDLISFPQVTEVEFGSLTGAHFVTHSQAAAFVIPTQSNGIFAIWINTGTETIPDLSQWGVTTYFQELISPTETTPGIASKLISQLGSGLSPNFALSLGADSTSVFFTSVAQGVQAEAFDINTGAQFFTIQQGS